MKILVVDDEFVSRNKAHKILSGFGDCAAAADGHEALEAFMAAHEDGSPYDVITIDIEMPGMDGVELLGRIRDWEKAHNILLGQGVITIMLTARGDAKSILPSFRHGCEAYIIKPFTKEDIHRVLKELAVKV